MLATQMQIYAVVLQAMTTGVPLAPELTNGSHSVSLAQTNARQRRGQAHKVTNGRQGVTVNPTIAMHVDPGQVQRANERKRVNKLMQRHLEMQRIRQLSHAARALEFALRTTTISDVFHLPSATLAATGKPDDVHFRAAFALLQPWLRSRDAWPHLALAEERLSIMAGRPFVRIISSLRASLEAGY